MFIRSLCRIPCRSTRCWPRIRRHHPFRWSGFGVRTGRAACGQETVRGRRSRTGHLLRLPGHGLCLGRECRQGALGEYGKTETFIDKSEGLLDGSPADQNTWMSHGVAVKTAPEGFEVLAHTEARPLPPCRTNPANCTACSGILKSSTPRWASSSSRPSCTSAQGSATTGMPPASSRIRSRRSARRSATHR